MKTAIAIVTLLVGSGTTVVALPALMPASGTVVARASDPHEGSQNLEPIAGLQPLFPDVPPGGYPHDTYAWGNCTWWVAFNRPVPPYLGDGWQWLANGAAAGMPTSSQPSVGAIVVYRPSQGYDPARGHVAVVVEVGPTSFRVSEMNYVGLGRVSERDSPWPDWHVEGFLPR